MKYVYSGGTFGFDGKGYKWHKLFKFPSFPKVTKTVTLNSCVGNPFAILHLVNSIWNKVSHHNPGIHYWLKNYYDKNLILSIAGKDHEIEEMLYILKDIELKGIQLSYSCPNVKNENKVVPYSNHDLYLKLNCNQDPFMYDLSNIKGLFINSVPIKYGAISGKLAQKRNWGFLEKHKDLNIYGCSFTNQKDIDILRDIGIKKFCIGSMMLINPYLVERL